jgi:hypothetical protein
MFELKISKGDLVDLVKKMSLPTGKNEYIFETVAPKITPEGLLEWIGKTVNFTGWVRAKKLDVSGITEPIRIVLNAKETLKTLSYFKEKNDIITLIHDTDRGQDIFTTNSEKRKKTTFIPSIALTEVKDLQETFPGQLADDGVIVYRGGRRPDLHITCDVKVFQDLVANTHIVMENKRKQEMPDIYHITFDEENKCLETVAGDATDRAHKVVIDEIFTDAVSGNGAVHYAMGFPDVMGVLSGDIDLYALANGPLWVSQQNEKFSVRYMVPPANLEK